MPNDYFGMGSWPVQPLQIPPEISALASVSDLAKPPQTQGQGEDIISYLTKYAQAAKQLSPQPQTPNMGGMEGWQGILAALTPGYMQGMQARIAHEQNLYNKQAGDASAMQRTIFEKAMGLQGEKMKEGYGIDKLHQQFQNKMDLLPLMLQNALAQTQARGTEARKTEQMKEDFMVGPGLRAKKELKATAPGKAEGSDKFDQKRWLSALKDAEKAWGLDPMNRFATPGEAPEQYNVRMQDWIQKDAERRYNMGGALPGQTPAPQGIKPKPKWDGTKWVY